jgi:mono/diheme cytochrome c family protein
LNQKTPGTLLAVGGLLCISLTLAGVGVGARSVFAAQEPDLRQQSTDKELPASSRRPKRDAHVSLGLGRVPDAAAAKRGEPLYQANCQACHGAQARGGQAPSLVRSVLVLHDDNNVEIPQVIKNGRTGGMPAFTNLTDAERHDIAEYLHQEVELAANRGLYSNASKMTTGDVARGKAFFAANCASCHSVTGDLAKVGLKYSQPSVLLARIAWPAGHGPRQATVTTAAGKKISGTLAHYDDFETTLKVADGKTETWPTDSIKVDIPDKLAGHRALLPKYTDDDLHDITRYLLELK